MDEPSHGATKVAASPAWRLAWRVARKRERCGRGGHILDLGVKVPLQALLVGTVSRTGKGVHREVESKGSCKQICRPDVQERIEADSLWARGPQDSKPDTMRKVRT